ncbi:MAG: hypothetical protein IIA85_00730 [Nanoarchaeota archaeon]|nr:hypothetical protein [Nanoarchaeota archaeon]
MTIENLESRTGNLEYRELTPEQATAIRRKISLGRELQILHPEIAEDYRNGMFHKEIAEKYNITEQFRVTEKVAEKAVGLSIRGTVSGFGLEPYLGLIEDKEELERLAQYHQVERGRKLYEQRKGIHGMSSEELSQAGRKSAISKGYVLYTDMEKRRILELHEEIGKGVHGKNPRIAQIVNQEFHKGKEVRNASAMRIFIGRAAN